MKAKVVVYKKEVEGPVTEDHFKIIEENLPQLKDGEFLAEAEYISVDPYICLTPFIIPKVAGLPVIGQQVAKIIETKNSKYPVGKYVVGEFGWRSHTVANASLENFLHIPPYILPDYADLPRSIVLGILGMPGQTAYFGFLEVCKPVKGNTVVITSAAGAVGTHVGQIAKILGCYVVGITGSDLKGERLIKEVGFDAYINYKDTDFKNKLIEATPNKIDCFFDNVGGEISSIILNRMNKFGRVAVCGAISNYNGDFGKASEIQTPVKINHLRLEGVHLQHWRDRSKESLEQNLKWIKERKLHYFETVVEGFDNTTKAFIGLFKGDNFGKMIVKCLRKEHSFALIQHKN